MSIFISYAKEDRAKAEELYLALEKRGLLPWMDKPPAPYTLTGLRPGEQWRTRLESEIRKASRVILLLSRTSVAKIGYVQREFRLALDVMNAMPPNARFAVPLMIDDCSPPELVVGSINLADLQWTALSDTSLGTFIDMLESDINA